MGKALHQGDHARPFESPSKVNWPGESESESESEITLEGPFVEEPLLPQDRRGRVRTGVGSISF